MNSTMEWLLQGDVSIQYQCKKYLMNNNDYKLRERIAEEGFGKRLLDKRKENGHWDLSFYTHKWISSHYTLLELRYLEIEPVKKITDTIEMILDEYQEADGSVNESRTLDMGDLCVNGMFLNYASFFDIDEDMLITVVDFIMNNVMGDGGFNCNAPRIGARHSSMHTTISVLEGLWEFQKKYRYRYTEISRVRKNAEEFLLEHELYKSSTTGAIIDKKWLMLSYPSRWRYDILRALVYFADVNHEYDERMKDALEVIMKKQRKDGFWPVQAKHPGQVHFDMEKTGTSSRWNTLRVLRVLDKYGEYLKQKEA